MISATDLYGTEEKSVRRGQHLIVRDVYWKTYVKKELNDIKMEIFLLVTL